MVYFSVCVCKNDEKIETTILVVKKKKAKLKTTAKPKELVTCIFARNHSRQWRQSSKIPILWSFILREKHTIHEQTVKIYVI